MYKCTVSDLVRGWGQECPLSDAPGAVSPPDPRAGGLGDGGQVQHLTRGDAQAHLLTGVYYKGHCSLLPAYFLNFILNTRAGTITLCSLQDHVTAALGTPAVRRLIECHTNNDTPDLLPWSLESAVHTAPHLTHCRDSLVTITPLVTASSTPLVRAIRVA